MSHRRPLLVAAAAAVACVATAWAQEPPPAPGCQGVATGDPRGDQRTTFGEAPDTLDLTGAFFRTDKTTSGRLLTTANIQVARVDPSAPAGVRTASWIMHWRDGDVLRYAGATVTGADEPVFDYGRVDGSSYVSEGGTSGRFVTGENGVIQIVLPEVISAPGQRLEAPYAASHVVSDVAGAPVAEEADLAPDDAQAGGRTFVVAECSPHGDAPVPEPGPPVAGPRGGSLEHAPPRLTVVTKSADARYVRRRGRIFLRLRSTGPVTKLQGLLERHRRPFGSGRLKAMHGKGTLIVRLTRRVRRGRYRLLLSGRDAERAPVTARARIRLR